MKKINIKDSIAKAQTIKPSLFPLFNNDIDPTIGTLKTGKKTPIKSNSAPKNQLIAV